MPDTKPPESQEVHPLYIRQEAEKVATIFARLYVNRGIALFGIGVAFTFWLASSPQVAGVILLIAGFLLLLASYDKTIYDRAFRNFEQRFSVSPKDYLANHPLR